MIRINGSGSTNAFGNDVDGQINGDSDLRCDCGNTSSWRGMSMGGGGISATCGPCGNTVTA